MFSEIMPVTNKVAVTPSDTAVLPLFRAVWVGVAGDIVTNDGVVLANAMAGVWHPIAGTQIKLATSATGVVVAL